MCRLLLLLLLALPLAAHAQAEPPWPRDPATGQIVFRGQLPWPDSVRTEPQRQALVRRWYRQGLTNQPFQRLRQTMQLADTTYAGVPGLSCYAFGISTGDDLEYMLCFDIQLVPGPAGLTYELSNFQASERGTDSLVIEPLEKTFPLPTEETQRIMAGFHQRLLQALRGWR